MKERTFLNGRTRRIETDCMLMKPPSGKWKLDSMPNLGRVAKYKKNSLTPRWLHDEERLDRLHDAMMQKRSMGEVVPSDWIEEYHDIMER